MQHNLTNEPIASAVENEKDDAENHERQIPTRVGQLLDLQKRGTDAYCIEYLAS